MWRYLGSAVGALLVSVSGCQPDCEDGYYAYRCGLYYSPYYGYYQSCYPVRYKCPGSSGSCKGSKCDDNPPPAACKLDADCEPGKICNAEGECAEPGSSSDAGVGGSSDTGATGGAASTGGSSSSAGAGGATSGNGGATGSGATSGDGAATSSTGGEGSGNGGSNSGNGGSATSTGGVSSGDGGATPGTGGSSPGGGGPGGERVRRFNFPCIRDTQCGAGDCSEGLCFTACESDSECGTADRCAVESGRRMCEPDPNPPVRCDRSADCLSSQECINGACHYKCDVDTDCADPQDRCTNGFCFPDRRPIAECVLNVECPTGLVCLDARCVDLANR